MEHAHSHLVFLQTVFAFQSLLSIFPQFMEAIGASVRVFELLDRVPRVNYDGEPRLESGSPRLDLYSPYLASTCIPLTSPRLFFNIS